MTFGSIPTKKQIQFSGNSSSPLSLWGALSMAVISPPGDAVWSSFFLHFISPDTLVLQYGKRLSQCWSTAAMTSEFIRAVCVSESKQVKVDPAHHWPTYRVEDTNCESAFAPRTLWIKQIHFSQGILKVQPHQRWIWNCVPQTGTWTYWSGLKPSQNLWFSNWDHNLVSAPNETQVLDVSSRKEFSEKRDR